MSKKQLKKRIKELEFENEMLRAMRPYPIYYQVYGSDASNVKLPPVVQETEIRWDKPPYEISSGSISSDPNANYSGWYADLADKLSCQGIL